MVKLAIGTKLRQGNRQTVCHYNAYQEVNNRTITYQNMLPNIDVNVIQKTHHVYMGVAESFSSPVESQILKLQRPKLTQYSEGRV